MITTLTSDAEVVYHWWSRQPASVKQWLQESREIHLRELKNADEPRVIYRAQGRLEILESLINMEKTLGLKRGN